MRRPDSRAVLRRTGTPRRPVRELRKAWRACEGRRQRVMDAPGYELWRWAFAGRDYHVHIEHGATRFEVLRQVFA